MLEKNIRELEQKYDCIIPEKRLKVQEVQMRLWEKLDEICKKYNLTYYFFWGALLGAVRHQGFIPWDDDIDVVMPRADYDKFGEVAPLEISAPYFLLSEETADSCIYWHKRLVDESTTCIFAKVPNPVKSHQGIAIDIVPVDGLPEGKKQRGKTYFLEKLYTGIANYALESPQNLRWKGKILRLVSKLYIARKGRKRVIQKLEAVRRSTDWQESDRFVVAAHHNVFKKADFNNVVYLDFEGKKIPAPNGYQSILKSLYGNYMEFPDKIFRCITDHEAMCFIVDPFVSYSDYFVAIQKQEKKKKNEIVEYHTRYFS